MANLLLTQRCVRACPYCFARKQMAEADGAGLLSWANLVYVADFLEAGNDRHVSLLGGEPALHPMFIDFLVYLMERRFSVRVFTSGVWTDRVLASTEDALKGAPPGQVSFTCNLNDPDRTESAPGERERIGRFLERFGPCVTPGFNIYRADFELDFLFDLVAKYALDRHLRVGLANPILDGGNAFIRPEDTGTAVGRLFSYREQFERHRIHPSLDCGFPLCQFDDSQLAWLVRHSGRELKFSCGPALDIGPDLSVWPCFPLSSVEKKSLFEFDDLPQLTAFYEERLAALRAEHGGIYPACAACPWRENKACAAGCLAHSLTATAPAAPAEKSNG